MAKNRPLRSCRVAAELACGPYCADDESPYAVERKFEMLDRVGGSIEWNGVLPEARQPTPQHPKPKRALFSPPRRAGRPRKAECAARSAAYDVIEDVSSDEEDMLEQLSGDRIFTAPAAEPEELPRASCTKRRFVDNDNDSAGPSQSESESEPEIYSEPEIEPPRASCKKPRAEAEASAPSTPSPRDPSTAFTTATPTVTAAIGVGTRVVVTGLVGRPEFNGQIATVRLFNRQTGRYEVVLPCGKEIALKTECMTTPSTTVAPSAARASVLGTNRYGHSHGCLCEGRFSAEICAAKRAMTKPAPGASAKTSIPVDDDDSGGAVGTSSVGRQNRRVANGGTATPSIVTQSTATPGTCTPSDVSEPSSDDDGVLESQNGAASMPRSKSRKRRPAAAKAAAASGERLPSAMADDSPAPAASATAATAPYKSPARLRLAHEESVGILRISVISSGGGVVHREWLRKLAMCFTLCLPKVPADYIARTLLSSTTESIVLFKNSHVIGGLCFRRHGENSADEIIFFGVEPAERRLGYGERIIAFMAEYTEQGMLSKMVCNVDRKAESFFRAHGFEKMRGGHGHSAVAKLNLKVFLNAVLMERRVP